MKPLILIVLLSLGLWADAAGATNSPSFFELTARWADRPVAEIEAQATRGDAVAQFYLGKSLVSGRGVRLDTDRGLALLRRAMEQGNSEAVTELARCHYLGLGLPVNHAEAVRLAREAVARGNAAGMNLLGLFNLLEVGMPENQAEAVRLFQQAAAAGNPVAMRNLAGLHLDGKAGFARDPVEANRWYLRAAEGGHTGSMVAYGFSLLHGRGITANPPEAVKWFLRAAASGDSEGLRLMAGKVSADPRAVLTAWRQAARLGDAEAQFHLAKLIASGEVEGQGEAESPQQLLLAAAEGKHWDAALMLGDRYRWGYGCPRDLVAAARWLLSAGFRERPGVLSAPYGEDPAVGGAIVNWFENNGEKIKPRHTLEDRQLAEAITLYLRALRQRDPEAMRTLAGWYLRGHLVPVDPVEAAAWYHLAAARGSVAAGKEREALEAKLSVAQQKEARGRIGRLIVTF